MHVSVHFTMTRKGAYYKALRGIQFVGGKALLDSLRGFQACVVCA